MNSTRWIHYFKNNAWQDLIVGHTPASTKCGLIYELSNPFHNTNEGLEIIDMSIINYTQPHYHPNTTIMYLCLQGSALIVQGYTIHEIKCDELQILLPQIAHFAIPSNNCIMASISIPPYRPENYIALSKSDDKVQFDKKQFLSLIGKK